MKQIRFGIAVVFLCFLLCCGTKEKGGVGQDENALQDTICTLDCDVTDDTPPTSSLTEEKKNELLRKAKEGYTHVLQSADSKIVGYFLFDLYKNGLPMLFVKLGTSDSNYQVTVYGVNGQGQVYLSNTVDGGYSVFGIRDKELIRICSQNNSEMVFRYVVEDAAWHEELVAQTEYELNINETAVVPVDASQGKVIRQYDLCTILIIPTPVSDTSPLDELIK